MMSIRWQALHVGMAMISHSQLQLHPLFGPEPPAGGLLTSMLVRCISRIFSNSAAVKM